MIEYADFAPTGFDPRGLGLDDRQDWLVLPCARNRDSEIRDESNFAAALERLGGEGENVEVHRFGHWANGWFELILIRPESKEQEIGEEIESALASYPILDTSDLSEREIEEASRVWENCYDNKERLAYIRRNRKDFEFQDWRDLINCVRGKWFSGDTGKLLG